MVKFEKETTVGVIFDGKMKMISVSKYTTCDDVTEMVMYSSAISDKSGDYALFETSHGIERKLAGKSPVLKVIRSWGSAKGDVSLLVRQADLITGKKIKISKARKKLEKMKSLLMANKTGSKTTNLTMHNNLDIGVNSKKQLQDKNVFGIRDANVATEQTGKFSLMKRYLNDVANTAKLKITASVDMSFKDMSTETVMLNSRQNCRADTTYTIDKTAHKLNVDVDDSKSVSYLDAAFVCDEPVDITVDLLNKGLCSDPDNSDAESAFYELCSGESDIEQSEDENVLEQNVYEKQKHVEDEKLRELFIQMDNNQSSYDKAMRSFMETLVEHPSDEDEGLSSIGSVL